jgi:hypothetical protein
MACGCSDTCNCILAAGPGISVSGAGTIASPYTITNTGDIGGGSTPVDMVGADLTLTSANGVVLVDTTGGAVTITLPATHTAGTQFTIKDYGVAGEGNADVTPITVDPNGNAIDGDPSNFIISDLQGAYTIVSNGTDWAII